MSTHTSVEDYKNMLEHSFHAAGQCFECPSETKVAFLGNNIFDFTTYDDDMDKLFGQKALDVCVAITEKTTFEYQKDNYQWYLIMVNMPFFEGKLEWGTSIRGAWWDNQTFEINSCALFEDYEQILNIKFNPQEWVKFVQAMKEFANE